MSLCVSRTSYEFQPFNETTLLAQFERDVYPVEKITLKYVTANMLTPHYKLRLLRFRLTPLRSGLRYTHLLRHTHTETHAHTHYNTHTQSRVHHTMGLCLILDLCAAMIFCWWKTKLSLSDQFPVTTTTSNPRTVPELHTLSTLDTLDTLHTLCTLDTLGTLHTPQLQIQRKISENNSHQV